MCSPPNSNYPRCEDPGHMRQICQGLHRQMEKKKVQNPAPKPPTFFNCFLSGKCNLNSDLQSAHTELQVRLLSVQYQAHGSYYSKFEVACHKDHGTHQHCVASNCRFKQSFRVTEVDIHWAMQCLYTKRQGLSLFEEIGSSCVFCTKIRARFIQASMGPKDPSA